MGSAPSRASEVPAVFTLSAPLDSGGCVVVEEERAKVRRADLPYPVWFGAMHGEAARTLNPKYPFQGIRITLMNRLGKRFSLSHKVRMETMELQWGYDEIEEVSVRSYQLAADFIDPKVTFAGKFDHSRGSLKVDVDCKCNLTNNLSCGIKSELTKCRNCSYGIFMFDYKGKSYHAHCEYESNGSLCADYMKSVTQNMSLGAASAWHCGLMSQTVSGIGARYKTNNVIASGQVMMDGSSHLSYIQNLSPKLSLASNFLYFYPTGDVISSVGCHFKFRDCLLWGKVDLNAVVSSYLERKISSDTRLVVSAEIDHLNKNYKFGYGLEFDGIPTFPWRPAFLH